MGPGHVQINRELRERATNPEAELSERTLQALRDFKATAVPIPEGTITFRARPEIVDLQVGEFDVDAGLNSSSTSGMVSDIFGFRDINYIYNEFGVSTAQRESGTVFEMHWMGKAKATRITNTLTEHVALPNTRMKVVARYDNVKLPEQPQSPLEMVRRYYIVEVHEAPAPIQGGAPRVLPQPN